MYNIYQQHYDKTYFLKYSFFPCPKIKLLFPYRCSEHHIHGKRTPTTTTKAYEK